MHGSSRAHAWLIHLMAGAALGAVIVALLWILSGGRPFGEVVGTSDVSAPTSAVTKRSGADQRVVAPTRGDATLESEPPSLSKGSTDLPFLEDKVSKRRPAAARKRTAAAKPTAKRPARKQHRTRSRPKPAVRVVAPPSETDSQEVPVAAVPSPVPTSAPAPAAPAPSKPAKRRAPTYVAGAGEG